MKKIILLFIVSASLNSRSFSQISKGSMLIGGDLSAFAQKQEIISGTEYKSNGFSFSPMLGVATKNNLVQGGYAQFGFSKINNTINPAVSKTSGFGGGYFIRRYWVIKNNFYGFIQGNAGVGYNKNSTEDQGSVSEYKQTTMSVSGSPGLSLRVSKKLHLETGLREVFNIVYQESKNTSTNPSGSDVLKSSQFSLFTNLNNFTSNLYVGFRILLDKK